jgi:hypothetical protein
MAKLNGWKRIGIVGSVVWILGAGLYTHDEVVKQISASYVQIDQDCIGETGGNVGRSVDVAKCDKIADDYAAQVYHYEWVEPAIVAFVPVPLGWGFVYLVLFLVRWIKRGFAKPF